MMWTCAACGQQFIRANQWHSCNDRTLNDFLKGKSAHTVALFDYFLEEFRKLGDFKLHPTKTLIGFAAKTRFGGIYRLGRNFIDVVLQFPERYDDNLCFIKIAEVPGTARYNHYFRMHEKEDLNDEIKTYLQMALAAASKEQ